MGADQSTRQVRGDPLFSAGFIVTVTEAEQHRLSLSLKTASVGPWRPRGVLRRSLRPVRPLGPLGVFAEIWTVWALSVFPVLKDVLTCL